jgi:quercetin dioxygenase-like cupin family protein
MRKSYRFERHSAFQFHDTISDLPFEASVFRSIHCLAYFRRPKMFKLSRLNRIASGASLGAAVFIAFAGIAAAGECSAGKMKDGARTSGETKPVGVTDKVIASIDLAPKGGDFAGQLLRMRKLTIAPGGVVPWHEHSVRPANIYILSGTIEEYRANCSVPIVHKAGEVTMEFGKGFAHWWKNTSSKPVVLLSSDVFQTEMKDVHMM